MRDEPTAPFDTPPSVVPLVLAVVVVGTLPVVKPTRGCVAGRVADVVAHPALLGQLEGSAPVSNFDFLE